MASQHDLVQLIGNKTCMVANELTRLVASEPACTLAQTWNMGFLVLAAAVAVLTALVMHERRKRFRNTYFR